MGRTALLAAALIASTAANAQWWNPNDPTPPKFRGTQYATKPVYDHRMLEQAQMQVHVALEVGDFAKIERMYAEFVETKLRTSDGSWMLLGVQNAFDSWFYVKDDSRIARFFSEWKQKVPDSKLLPIMEAEMWQRTAWRARSGRGASSLTPEMQQEFGERLRKASRALDASAEAGRDSPIWYWVALIVAGSSGRPAAQFDALFEEAAGKFPTYLPLYLTRVNYHLPQWGGSFEKVDAFVRRSEERTAATDGKAFYAWLYVDVASKSGGDEDFFRASRVSWPYMRDAFDDMIRRYPDMWNKIVYATFACLARDREATAKVLTMLPPDAQLGAYTDGISMDACRRFALEKS